MNWVATSKERRGFLICSTVLALLMVSQLQQVARADEAPEGRRTSGVLKAIARFDMDGVKGHIKFTQKSPKEPTLIEYDLTGLKGNTNFYHVHSRPLPKFEPSQVRNNLTAIAQICGPKGAGGHHNPLHKPFPLEPLTLPLEDYEIGDLAGKHGPFKRAPGSQDRYVGSYTDETLPLLGEHGIIGRSFVIHKKNTGPRWVCAQIRPTSYAPS